MKLEIPRQERARGYRARATRVVVSLLTLMLGSDAFGLDPARTIFQYHCRSWTRESGLAVNGINAIAQTADGYLWFGTHQGLLRFDGVEFTLVGIPPAAGFRSAIVPCLVPSRQGGLWFGLRESGYGHYDNENGQFLAAIDRDGVNRGVHALLETEEGELFIGAGGNFVWRKRDGNPGTVFDTKAVLGGVNVLAAHLGTRGRVWIGTANKGLYFWEQGRVARVPDSSLDADLIFAIAEDRHGRLWLGTQSGLRCLDAQFQRQEVRFPGTEIRALLVDRHGALWIGTSGAGLVRFQNGDV